MKRCPPDYEEGDSPAKKIYLRHGSQLIAEFMFNAQLKFVKFKKFTSTGQQFRERKRVRERVGAIHLRAAHIGLKATPAAAWAKLKISFYACRLQFLCADIQHIIYVFV